MTHTYSKLLYHLVWSTKNRQPIITPTLRDRLYAYLKSIVENEGGIAHIIGGMPDHIHLLIELKPTIAIASVAQRLKTHSTKWVKREIPNQNKFCWQEGYGVFTVGYSTSKQVFNYIDNQEKHHGSKSYDVEFIEFLRRQGIDFDDRFVLG